MGFIDRWVDRWGADGMGGQMVFQMGVRADGVQMGFIVIYYNKLIQMGFRWGL